MSREEFKARGRVTQKMTRDGLVERNEATGSENRISKRESECDLRGGSQERPAYSQLGNTLGNKGGQRKHYGDPRQQRQSAQNAETPPSQQRGDTNLDPQPQATHGAAAPEQAKAQAANDAAVVGSADNMAAANNPVGTAKPSQQAMYSHLMPGAMHRNHRKSDAEGKLQFAVDEPALADVPKGKKLARAERQLDRASGKLEKARGKLPAKKKLRSQRVYNEQSGKSKRKLYFDKEAKPQKDHLKGSLPLRPVKAATNAAVVHAHRKLFQAEDDNMALKAAHKGEMIAEGGVRTALRFNKAAPYRKVHKLEHRAMKKQVNMSYRKALDKNPKLKSSMRSRMMQKRRIKKAYAKKARDAQKAAKHAKTAAKEAGGTAMKAVKFVGRRPVVSLVLLLLGLLMMIVLSMCSVSGGLGGSGMGGIAASTYLAADEDMLGAEAAYAGMEADLQDYLDNYAFHNPGYDEYHFDLDNIWHDPYVLISIISALHEGEWTLEEVLGTLAMLFGRQYTVTETVTVEVRYRTETRTATDPETGAVYEYTVQVPYNYYICTVRLENFNLSHLPVFIMGEEQLSRYSLFMATLGNRPDLFPTNLYPWASTLRDYERYVIPPEALSDPVFAAMIAEAERHLGRPYVWGGSNPSTSFDCSGFVSWVINQTGWNVGRLGARGLYAVCTPVSPANAKPGDLVFFHSTYRTTTPGISHVGIYVGNGMMIHCGNPISYTSIETNYWRNHFYGFARLLPPN